MSSPPYFFREGYTTERTQSWVRYYNKDLNTWYRQWVNGFLEPTLLTAIQWLRKGGYLIWNIADFQIGSITFPLEFDSQEIIESTKIMKHEITYKMVLSQATGWGREVRDETGSTRLTAKNFCKVNGDLHKHEPIFVYRKMK